MVKGFSEITLQEALEKLDCWCPVQIWIDGKIIWDDELSIDDSSWIPYHEFKNNVGNDSYYHQTVVSSIEIEIVHFHHSIIQIYTQLREE